MKKPKYFRKGKVIRGPSGDQSFKSHNLAKQESRKIQMKEDGALGRGSLIVVEKLPELQS